MTYATSFQMVQKKNYMYAYVSMHEHTDIWGGIRQIK